MKTSCVLALLAIALPSCGGGSGSETGDGAVSGSDAATGGCNMPSCLQALGPGCVPEGACVSEIGTSTMTVCYENGLRYETTVNAAGPSPTAAMTVSNGGTTCYTGTASGIGGTVIAFTIKNPAGTTIATMTQDTSTGATSITCTGGQPVELDPACWGGTGCDLGACP